MTISSNNINQINDIDGLEINNLLTTFNEYESKNNEIRLIEQDKKNKLVLKPNYYTKYKDTLESLESEFNTNLTDIKWVYIAHLKNPNNIDYSTNYYKIKNKLDSILDKINMTSIEIQKNIVYLNDISNKINKDLDYYKNENKELLNKVDNVKSVDSTSKAIIDNYTDLYKNQRSYNIGMVITFILAFFLMRKIFSESSVKESTISSSTTTPTINNIIKKE
jgi:hypothetical protein